MDPEKLHRFYVTMVDHLDASLDLFGDLLRMTGKGDGAAQYASSVRQRVRDLRAALDRRDYGEVQRIHADTSPLVEAMKDQVGAMLRDEGGPPTA